MTKKAEKLEQVVPGTEGEPLESLDPVLEGLEKITMSIFEGRVGAFTMLSPNPGGQEKKR